MGGLATGPTRRREQGRLATGGLPTTLIAFGDDGTGNPFCVEVGGTSSEVFRWNWIDLAAERSEGSVDEFTAERCSKRT